MSWFVRTIERIGNPVSAPAGAVSAAAQAMHARLSVADLHADTLLASRDPRLRSTVGHVDLPRLRAGGVGIQVFSIVTNMPLCLRLRACPRAPNLVAFLAAAQGWPASTWTSDKARALYQAARLQEIAADPAAGLMLLRCRDDLARLATAPSANRHIGALLAVEGAQAIGDDVAGVDELAEAGVRMLGLAHYFDNAVAGSAHGRSRGGISAFGCRVLHRAAEHGMIFDLAHASARTIEQFLLSPFAINFVVSHTGLRAMCDDPRNLTDEQVRRIVRAGGLIGTGAWSRALGLPRHASAATYVGKMVETIRRATALADTERPGSGHCYVGLGSDFDGWVAVGFDASGWARLTEGLLQCGFSEAAVQCIMGGNVHDLLRRALPQK